MGMNQRSKGGVGGGGRRGSHQHKSCESKDSSALVMVGEQRQIGHGVFSDQRIATESISVFL
jgi:hypothetical protein